MLNNNTKISVILWKKQTKQELVNYLHAACFSPVQLTWVKAIKNNNFLAWPGLTETLVTKYLPLSTATVQCHVHQQRHNLQSTKKRVDKTTKQEEHDMFPAPDKPNNKCNHKIYAMIKKEDVVTAYQDLTGSFPIKSLRGSEYVLVGYHYDANCILGYPVRDR